MQRVVLGLPAVLFALSFSGQALAQNVQAEALQRAYGISAQEAQRRLNEDAAAAELRRTLEAREPQSFAGMYGQHQPEFRIYVALTGNAAATLAKYTSDPTFVAVQAKIPLTALERRRNAVTQALLRTNVPFATDLDLRTGKVRIKHPDRSAAARAAGASGLGEGDVEILQENGAPMPAVDILGGKQVTGIWTYSSTKYFERGTLGFNVTNGTVRGTLTAGHFMRCRDAAGNLRPGCTVNGVGFYNPTNVVDPPSTSAMLDFQSERLGGDYDVEWRAGAGHTFRNVINYGVEMPITQTYPHTSLVPGTSIVCKMGHATGYTCGTVTSTTEQVMWFGTAGTYVRVKNNQAGVMAAEGDSGGPVFGQNTAYGLVTYVWGTGQTNAGEMGFMPISRISVLGVSVLTQ